MGRQPGSRNLSEPILSRLERARPSVARAAFAEICMNERERLPDASSRDTRGFLRWRANGRYVSRIRLCSWRDISAFNMGIRALARWEEEKEGWGEGDRRSVCSDFNERHESGFWLMVLRLHARQRRTLRLPTSPLFPALQSDYLFLSFFPTCRNHFDIRLELSAIVFFPRHFRQCLSFSRFTFSAESSLSPFYLPVDSHRTGILRYSHSLSVMSSMKHYTWCHLSRRSQRERQGGGRERKRNAFRTRISRKEEEKENKNIWAIMKTLYADFICNLANGIPPLSLFGIL